MLFYDFPFRLSALHPKGPKIENIQDRPPRLNFSSEIEISSEPPTTTLFFVGNSGGQDFSIESMDFSSKIEKFKRAFFQDYGP